MKRTQLEAELLESRDSPSSIDPGLLALQQIDNFVIIYQENWSFDALYGSFPGANGLANAENANGSLIVPQIDKNGNVITNLPNPSTQPGVPGGLPAQPYDLSQFISPDATTNDIIHRFYHEQLQIANGVLQPGADNMDKFVTWSDNGTLVLSNFNATNLPEGLLAQQFTMDDNFFHAAYGGSFLNHQFLVAAAAPLWEQPIPAGFQSSWDPTTQTLADGNLTIDGKYVVNTTFGAQAPHPNGIPASKLLNPINDNNPAAADYTPTIGDRLNAKNVSWKWYSGGWNNALAGHADPLFQFHHQPFAYYANYAPFLPNGSLNPATTGPNAHLQDELNFFSDLAHGKLPKVSFIKPLGPDNEHPGYTSLLRGQQHVADIVHAIQNSSSWKHTAIIITYDENGGRWDHVSPPTMADGWGDGTRVPAIVISPYSKFGFVDHTQYDTLSILKTLEVRFALQALNQRDGGATPLTNSLQPTPNASIGRAYLQPDADHFGSNALIVEGTEGNDYIHLTQDGSATRVQITGPLVNFDHYFQGAISRIEIYGQGGSDSITVDPAVTIPAFIFGGGTFDKILGGGGPTVAVGGTGGVDLVGGAGPSILISGLASGTIKAGAGGAIEVAGSTTFDANLSALKALENEWSRTDVTYQQKVDHLDGQTTGGLNGPYFLNTSTVQHAGMFHMLLGGSALDWFFAHLPFDLIMNQQPGEVVTNI
jgi:phospholipase C